MSKHLRELRDSLAVGWNAKLRQSLDVLEHDFLLHLPYLAMIEDSSLRCEDASSLGLISFVLHLLIAQVNSEFIKLIRVNISLLCFLLALNVWVTCEHMSRSMYGWGINVILKVARPQNVNSTQEANFIIRSQKILVEARSLENNRIFPHLGLQIKSWVSSEVTAITFPTKVHRIFSNHIRKSTENRELKNSTIISKFPYPRRIHKLIATYCS